MDISPTVFMDNNNMKDNNFRHSVASTATNTTTTTTSTQRLSVASSLEEDSTLAYCPRPYSLTNLLNANRPIEHTSFKNKLLSKFHANSKKAISDDTVMQNRVVIDPWCVSVRYALEHAICSDWMYKYETPTFSFAKSWKKRYCVLMDRTVYVFKSLKLTSPAKEYFVLTEDTFVFVTEEFKKGYVIEIRKPNFKWNIRCNSIDQMKSWLDLMKKVIACIKIGYDDNLNFTILSSITLTDDYRILIPNSTQNTRFSNRQSLPTPSIENNINPSVTLNRKSSTSTTSTLSSPHSTSTIRRLSSQRQSLSEIPDWETIIPPQLPPPRTRPPPIPLPTVSE
ncbi:hypothetical protein RO3G_09841 [Rhizopus delemar RA 99-880]|uniref:PH domain-containing protein n=2 Tax=Rhizopus TaxID=4842 RepID=I1C9K1_RHIO9|nr:hypothetical protein RO3G_09841 [Rhizopus delemar RA 99-880]|eukprot:EIE85131.1 hypothetical protein RO3G_09841 [Rhizopus delemar RA 99-880]